MLDSYERGEVTPPPVSSYGGSPGLLALHSSLYATPTSRAFDIDSGIDGNESPMSMDTQIIPVRMTISLLIPAAAACDAAQDIGNRSFPRLRALLRLAAAGTRSRTELSRES